MTEGGAAAEPLRVRVVALLEAHGEGGFGEVWRAEEEGQLRRSVALKVLEVDMDSAEVVARYGVVPHELGGDDEARPLLDRALEELDPLGTAAALRARVEASLERIRAR